MNVPKYDLKVIWTRMQRYPRCGWTHWGVLVVIMWILDFYLFLPFALSVLVFPCSRLARQEPSLWTRLTSMWTSTLQVWRVIIVFKSRKSDCPGALFLSHASDVRCRQHIKICNVVFVVLLMGRGRMSVLTPCIRGPSSTWTASLLCFLLFRPRLSWPCRPVRVKRFYIHNRKKLPLDYRSI